MNKETLLGILGFIFFLIFGYAIQGGFSSTDSHPSSGSTVNIDCRDSGWVNSKYCNGEYESQMRDEAGTENSYYQNSVR